MNYTKKLISIVSPAFNEEGCIDELAKRLKILFEKESDKYDFESIIVDNGSTDKTYEKLIAIRNQDARFKILSLSRNFRCDGAINAGLAFAKGDAAIILYSDLEDPVEVIHEFLRKWEEGYENVYGVVRKRNGSLLRKINSNIFYHLVNKMTNGIIPKYASDYRLVDKKLYEAVNNLPEKNRFMRGLFAWAGFKSIGVPFDRVKRFSGESKAYSLAVFKLAATSILSFSYFPLRMVTVIGTLLATTSFLAILVLVYRFTFYGVPFPGFGTIICLMLLLFGFLFMILGVIGEYIAMIFEETKSRPNYIIREKIGL
ncbi:MAG: glycosyltransferase family 2 protein [Rickettsiales bacterium]|nr:glycosyltransferase family 2 protein [Rickettsiales bacterium]